MDSAFLKLFRKPYEMKNKKLAYFLALAALALLIINIVRLYPNGYDTSFLLLSVSNILIIISMLITIFHKKRDH